MAHFNIITKFSNEDRVRTLFFNGSWITLFFFKKESKSVKASNYLEAGQNHLKMAAQIKEGLINV